MNNYQLQTGDITSFTNSTNKVSISVVIDFNKQLTIKIDSNNRWLEVFDSGTTYAEDLILNYD